MAYSRVARMGTNNSKYGSGRNAYDEKIAVIKQQIATCDYSLSQDWCVGDYEVSWKKDRAKLVKKLAKLEAE